jgi:hypothetical protein
MTDGILFFFIFKLSTYRRCIFLLLGSRELDSTGSGMILNTKRHSLEDFKISIFDRWDDRIFFNVLLVLQITYVRSKCRDTYDRSNIDERRRVVVYVRTSYYIPVHMKNRVSNHASSELHPHPQVLALGTTT